MGLFAAVAIVLLSWSCGRTIEDEGPRELVEHRIEPCRQWCTAMMSPQCGGRPEDLIYSSVEDCVEECAAVDPVYAWDWDPRQDGSDACAEEWFAAADCIDALACEEQRRYFREFTPDPHDDYPCKEQLDAQRRCFRAEQAGGGT